MKYIISIFQQLSRPLLFLWIWNTETLALFDATESENMSSYYITGSIATQW